MTEIALALAMGFFSIMVLTIISIGSGAVPVGQKFQKFAAPDACAAGFASSSL